ncbi:formate--tetrahydrofolate ligase [Auritidibacter ignavus]|uniref:formate--tetrahydrofolate ligase n=1 Tax=Auritidibacter ignavus TaxID=678932 RepID=UPI0024B97456|nr:formate--tetrahydrofolate ligase [Auritidibacter ignavus]WHS35954.1 formate--tetrahydrofolate ligase [Auritidibacter ignavus]
MNDAEISATATLQPIHAIAERLGVSAEHLIPYGHTMAKIDLTGLGLTDNADAQRSPGKVVLVTACSPTPAGEGKTTVAIGLADGLNRIGVNTALALREPSLGPVFGLKGGGTGGGYAQVVPMDKINLHFTGDLHAISAAHNLLCALVDNHIHQGNQLGIDPRTITIKRCVDLNDRALRHTVIGLGGRTQGVPREDGFEITVATETMAIFCLATDRKDLKQRLSQMIIGYTYDQKPVTVGELGPEGAQGAMAVLLNDALDPNLVQTLSGTPALVHGGPFANIAHGANSVIATNTARALADVVITEAGFGADLGAEKFMHITGPAGGFSPDAIVVVATLRALKYNGGVSVDEANQVNPEALRDGVVNLDRHLDHLAHYDRPVVVAINTFPDDTQEEITRLIDHCQARGVTAEICAAWGQGADGAEALARVIRDQLQQTPHQQHRREQAEQHAPDPLSPQALAGLPLQEKISVIARTIYGADGVKYSPAALKQLGELAGTPAEYLPVCVAKTPFSFSDDRTKLGAPTGFQLTIQRVRLRAGAGFVVVYTGRIMTMPGLPKHPAAEAMDVADSTGEILNIF